MKNVTPITVPRAADVAQVADPEVEDANKVQDLVQAFPIDAPDGTKEAVVWIAEIKTRREQVDAKRRQFITPLETVIADINAFFKPALEAFDKAEKAMKEKVVAFTEASLKTRDRLLAQVAAAPQDAREAIVKQADAITPPKVDGLSIRDNWGGEVTDPTALLSWAIEAKRVDVLAINEKALVALTKAMGHDPGIPGWTAINRRVVAVTAGKVKK